MTGDVGLSSSWEGAHDVEAKRDDSVLKRRG